MSDPNDARGKAPVDVRVAHGELLALRVRVEQVADDLARTEAKADETAVLVAKLHRATTRLATGYLELTVGVPPAWRHRLVLGGLAAVVGACVGGCVAALVMWWLMQK